MNGLKTLLLTACCLSVSPVMAAQPVVAPTSPGLVAHKALYDVKLVSTKAGSQMVNISGKMFYEWKPSCEGWITNHRFSLDYEYADAPQINISSDFSTFESFDGKSLNFSSRRRRDGEVYEELRGNALLESKGGPGKATYTLPENLAFDLDANTSFPTQHTLKLLDAAKSGKKFYNVRIFDGSDDDGPVDINSFIGAKTAASAGLLSQKAPAQKDSPIKPVSVNTIDKNLAETPGWKVRMAFFPASDVGSSSDYELSMLFHENGVIDDMVIEYGDFTVSQKLIALEKVPAETCKN